MQQVQIGHIAREQRDSCWCGAVLEALPEFPSFGRCRECGTYVNRRPPRTDELTRLYGLGTYWRTRQRMRGYPAIEQRGEFYRADGRLARWLELVEQFAPSARTVVEIGCAPGVLLQELAARGRRCIGVEINDDVAAWMRRQTDLDIRGGSFPGISLPPCELFLAFDVLEHSPSPVAFLVEAARLLVPGGIAIVQTAIDRYDFPTPFGERGDLFDDVEHLYLFTDNAMLRLARLAGLEILHEKSSTFVGGELCVLRKAKVG
jgi:SAM-dependent methyltransferase